MGMDHGWYKNRVYQGVMRKAIIKFVNRLTPNSRPAKILRKYFETGKISDRDAQSVMRDWYKVLIYIAIGGTAVLLGLLYRAGVISGVHFFVFPVINTIMKMVLAVVVLSILPKSEQSYVTLKKRLDKASDYLVKRKDDAKFKQWINKQLRL
jgi:hypothetical protein